MKKSTVSKVLLVILILVIQIAHAGIISPKELAKIVNDKDVIIISARKTADYDKVHIPGAVNLWHNDLYKAGEIKGLLKSPDEIVKILGSKGISKTSRIIIYDGGQNTFSGRLYWILMYLGCENVDLLNGQMKMWRKARKPVTKKATEVSSTTFVASLDEGMIASKAYVKAHKDDASIVLVDVRSKEEYDGQTGQIERKGHIPGTVHFDYKNVLNEDGTLKSKVDLEKITKDVGITPDKEIILHCETSVRAGIVYLALTSILDFPKVTVYDGALYEWSSDQSCPME